MKILLADDHAIVRKGLAQLLSEEFHDAEITEVGSSAEVFQQAEIQVWDIILLDISMPGRNGIEILKQLRSSGIKAPILMLSMHPEEQYAVRSLRAGASGFLNKESANEELLLAFHKLLEGKKYITATVAEKLADNLDHNGVYESLSDREVQVFQLIAAGKTVSEIAIEISLSVSTISTYRARILDKLSLRNNSEVVRYAVDHNII